MVIRVEDRNDLGSEQKLNAHAVSEYFSEDYATFMVPFVVDGETDYRPVVISEFASQGDLSTYAKKLEHETKDEIAGQAQLFFTKLNDFCIKLMDSGHYHPDIKLSNFLTDGTRIIISDRKAITDKKAPRVCEISSSPLYAAPEYQDCITVEGEMDHRAARRTTVNMPSYMPYQLGMALKEFMQGASEPDPDEFLEWTNIAEDIPSPSERVKNIGVLIQELTRANPKDRLSIAHFQTLLAQADTLSHTDFMIRLEELSPKASLSTQASIEVIEQILLSDHLPIDLKEKLDIIATTQDVSQLARDPRANFSELMLGKPLTHIKSYLEEVERALLAADIAKAHADEHSTDVPRSTTIAELGTALPPISDIALACLELNKELNGGDFPGLSTTEQARLQEVMRHIENMSLATSSPAVAAAAPAVRARVEERTASPGVSTDATMIVHGDAASSSTMIVHEDDAASSSTMIVHEDDAASSSTMVVHGGATSNSSNTSDPGSPSADEAGLSQASSGAAKEGRTHELRSALKTIKDRKPASEIAITIKAGDAPEEPETAPPAAGFSR